MLAKRMERVREEREARAEKGEGRDDDGPPEEVGSKTRMVFRDDRKAEGKRRGGREVPVCKDFVLRGRCHKAGCAFRHEKWRRKGAPEKKSLYQLVCFSLQGTRDGLFANCLCSLWRTIRSMRISLCWRCWSTGRRLVS